MKIISEPQDSKVKAIIKYRKTVLMKRAVIFIIDALGAGSMPDYKDFDENKPSNTLQNVAKYSFEKHGGLKMPNFQKLGLANLEELPGLGSLDKTTGSFGKMAEWSKAKDTITGHWEMVGVKLKHEFPYYPEGFPKEIIEKFKEATGLKEILCNAPASGTTVINDLGDEHLKTGYPIIYTSADSVLQIAAHVDVVDLDTQYMWCEIAREIMRGEHEVARIIARPFTTNPNFKEGDPNDHDLPADRRKYMRVGDKRHDYAVLPHSKSILESVVDKGGEVLGIGKIEDIFATIGITKSIKTKDNMDGMDQLIRVLKNEHPDYKDINSENQIIFINLVETDANFGHRRDPEGYKNALEAIDKRIPEVLETLNENDIFLMTADHGCDPCSPGSDHTREYVPLIIYGKSLTAKDLGIRESFADLGATILDWFKIEDSEIELKGKSCLN